MAVAHVRIDHTDHYGLFGDSLGTRIVNASDSRSYQRSRHRPTGPPLSKDCALPMASGRSMTNVHPDT